MTMKCKLLALLGSAALLSAVPLMASAHTQVFLGINLGALFAPPPVIYAAPPVVYPAPSVVYVPRARYYAPPVYYVPGAYYGRPVYMERRGWYRHGHWDRDHGDRGDRRYWRHHHHDDDGGD